MLKTKEERNHLGRCALALQRLYETARFTVVQMFRQVRNFLRKKSGGPLWKKKLSTDFGVVTKMDRGNNKGVRLAGSQSGADDWQTALGVFENLGFTAHVPAHVLQTLQPHQRRSHCDALPTSSSKQIGHVLSGGGAKGIRHFIAR